jgi:MFS family permease
MVALGYGVISPAMLTFARTFGVSIKAVTFLVAVFSLSRLCFAPVSGLLVQRLDERRIYIGGLLIVGWRRPRVRFPSLIVAAWRPVGA